MEVSGIRALSPAIDLYEIPASKYNKTRSIFLGKNKQEQGIRALSNNYEIRFIDLYLNKQVTVIAACYRHKQPEKLMIDEQS